MTIESEEYLLWPFLDILMKEGRALCDTLQVRVIDLEVTPQYKPVNNNNICNDPKQTRIAPGYSMKQATLILQYQESQTLSYNLQIQRKVLTHN